MPVAGNTVQSFDMEIINGNLVIGRYAHRVGVIMDVDIAIHELLNGKRIFLHAYADKVDRVTKTIRMTLGQWPPENDTAQGVDNKPVTE